MCQGRPEGYGGGVSMTNAGLSLIVKRYISCSSHLLRIAFSISGFHDVDWILGSIALLSSCLADIPLLTLTRCYLVLPAPNMPSTLLTIMPRVYEEPYS